MKDFPFSLDRLSNFSNSDPYSFIPPHLRSLKQELEFFQKELSFPALHDDVGSLIAFFLGCSKPKKVFEMGSGYGHSAFWHFIGSSETVERVVLTEKRDDLKKVFDQVSWPVNWKRRIEYWQGDAFERLEKEEGKVDFFLVDGVKADYLEFIKKASRKLSKGGLIAVDNSFWRGSFLDQEVRSRKKSAAKVHEMHQWIKSQHELEAVFVPFVDGLTLLRRP